MGYGIWLIQIKLTENNEFYVFEVTLIDFGDISKYKRALSGNVHN